MDVSVSLMTMDNNSHHHHHHHHHPHDNSTLPGDCGDLPFSGLYFLWNQTDDVITLASAMLVSKVKSIYVLFTVGVVGVFSNVINMAVFGRQGLRERINLCLFALSLADLIYIARNFVLFGERLNPKYNDVEYGPLFTWMVNNNLLGLEGFVWVSQFMSAVIASERCFCVLFPRHSKTILTTPTMAVIIVVAFVVIVGGFFVVSLKFSVVCAFDRSSGQSRRALWTSDFYRQNHRYIEWFIFLMYGIVPALFLVVVIVTTVITAHKLKQVAHWRNKAVIPSTATSSRAATSSTRGVTASSRELALTRMLVGASLLFVACFLPYFIFRVTCVFVTELNAGRRYNNLYMMLLDCLHIASFVNCSCNAFVYYSMGSRYRHHFWELLRCCWCNCCRRVGRRGCTSQESNESGPSIINLNNNNVENVELHCVHL